MVVLSVRKGSAGDFAGVRGVSGATSGGGSGGRGGNPFTDPLSSIVIGDVITKVIIDYLYT